MFGILQIASICSAYLLQNSLIFRKNLLHNFSFYINPTFLLFLDPQKMVSSKIRSNKSVAAFLRLMDWKKKTWNPLKTAKYVMGKQHEHAQKNG